MRSFVTNLSEKPQMVQVRLRSMTSERSFHHLALTTYLVRIQYFHMLNPFTKYSQAVICLTRILFRNRMLIFSCNTFYFFCVELLLKSLISNVSKQLRVPKMMMWKAADFQKLITEITIDFVGRLQGQETLCVDKQIGFK